VESPAMAISSVVLRDFHAKDGVALIAAGALKPDGFEAIGISLADHQDVPVNLIWSSETGGYAYFSPAVGLVRVDDNALLHYRLDISWLLQWISRQLGFPAEVRQVCLIPDRLWDLGDVWLGEGKRKQRKTAVYLARRLNELETVEQVVEMLRMHSARPGKLILTTTQDPNFTRVLTSNCAVVLPIKSCARAGVQDFVVDTAIIHSAAHGLRPSATASPVRLQRLHHERAVEPQSPVACSPTAEAADSCLTLDRVGLQWANGVRMEAPCLVVHNIIEAIGHSAAKLEVNRPLAEPAPALKRSPD
jgi:hypothetical protein